ncbi:hypothetical protein MW887_011578 [Aspergillus wentii]|nr:hypothetical protein MW887_011578 [Aspergillus wentii]
MRQLGKNGPLIPRLGLGLMGASGMYGMPLVESEHMAFLDEAYKRGETFWDTTDEYGTSEDLLGKWFAANPDKRNDIVLATKFGIKMTPDQQPRFRVDSSPEYCREAIHSPLKRLGVPYKLISLESVEGFHHSVL